MLDPLVLVLPGLIAFHLYQDLPKADMAYPTLVNNVLPVPLVGFFGAVLFGAVISTFNGFLNSASTLFSMVVYRRIITPKCRAATAGHRRAQIWFLYRYRFGDGRAVDRQRAAGAV